MDAVSIVLIAIALILGLTAIFAFFTYIFLNIFRRPSASQAVKTMKSQGEKTKK